MNRLKRPARLLLVIVLIFCIAMPASAARDMEGAKTALINGFQQNATVIDLSQYELTQDDVAELYYELYCNGDIPWNVDSYSMEMDYTGKILTLTPVYLKTEAYDPAIYEAAIQKVLDATVFDGMKDWQIALSAHDYLVSHFEYDETYSKYTGYDLLVNGTAVCQGYTLAYCDLLEHAGIPTNYVISGPMDHAWCQVQIGGEWYHVDATWDDPISDNVGRAYHDYFLLSDSRISDTEHKHHSWDSSIQSTDTRFESGVFWAELTSPVIYLDADTCVLRRDNGEAINLYVRKESTGTETLLCSVELEYIDIGLGGPINFGTDGLSYWNGLLYFNDMQRVYSVTPAGGDLKVVYGHDVVANKQIMLSSLVSDGKIQITMRNNNAQPRLENVTVPLPDHVHNCSSKVTPATCTTDGYTTYTCTDCGISYKDDVVYATGHHYIANVVNATCLNEGYTEYTCSNCYDSFQIDPRPAYGHRWNNGVVTVKPALGSEGVLTYTCTVCSETKTEAIPALNEETCSHGTTIFAGMSSADCYNDGYTGDVVCAICYEVFEKGTVIPVLGHNYEGTEVPPSENTGGYTLYTCTRCGLSYSVNQEPTQPENIFTDVHASDYFYDSVLWAVGKNITKGTGEGVFSPNLNCTRNQVVTFLWRAAGEPESASSNNPFVDVAESDYFYKAVLWAVEQEITNGMDATHFGSTQECTRAQVATFLWRTMGKPKAANPNHPFTDIKSGDYYYEAVLWAVEAGVTNGMSPTTFAPDSTCTRGQIVTFLYRALK